MRGARLAAIGGALAIAAGVALRVTADWDAFWHLRIGQEALAHRSTLPVDPFSYVARGRPWPYKDLVADVILYAGVPALGFAWLAICKAFAVLCAGAGLWRAPRAPRPALVVAALGLYVGGVGYRLAERPLLFTLALVPVLLGLLERARREARGLGAAVALLWLWAQLHREVLVGLVLLFGFAQYLTLARLAGGRAPWLLAARPSTRRVAQAQGAWIAAAALIALNPSGLALYRSTLAVFAGDALKQSILEWQPLPIATLWRLLPASAALASLGGIAIVASLVLAARRRHAGPVDAWHLGAWLLFVERTLDSVRWLPYLCAVSAIVVLVCADAWLGERPAARAVAAAGALGAIVLSFVAHPLAFGLGEARGRFPSAALAFAARAGLHERVANTLPFGGYVLWRGWPRFLVAIDGRNDMVYPPAYLLRCRDGERDPAVFAAMRAEDGADWVLATNEPGVASHGFLADDPAWALAFHSDAALVWVRRDAYPALPALRFVPRLDRDVPVEQVLADARAAEEEAALVAELERLYADDPDGISAHLWLAQLYDALHRGDRRDAVMRHLLRVRPDWVTRGVR